MIVVRWKMFTICVRGMQWRHGLWSQKKAVGMNVKQSGTNPKSKPTPTLPRPNLKPIPTSKYAPGGNGAQPQYVSE